MKVGKIIVSIIVIAVLFWGSRSLFRKDTYTGFFYPDANNLLNDIQSEIAFDSLEACRDWVIEQTSIYNSEPNGSVYDYECGKNCDLLGSKPYICEETLE